MYFQHILTCKSLSDLQQEPSSASSTATARPQKELILADATLFPDAGARVIISWPRPSSETRNVEVSLESEG